MPNSGRDQGGIQPSKKYAVGTVHENGTGKFTILDRYLDQNDGKTIMLKIQWLDTGDIDVNKEVNINASIWKFQKRHGLLDSPSSDEDRQPITLQDLDDKLGSIYNLSEIINEERRALTAKVEDVLEISDKTFKRLEIGDGYFKDIFEIIKTQNATIEQQTKLLKDLMTVVTANSNKMNTLAKDLETISKDVELSKGLLDTVNTLAGAKR
jgi:hypothetical protein